MDIPDIVKNKLIELDAENRQLKLDIARKESTLKNRDENLAELEEENRRLLKENADHAKASKDVTTFESRIGFLQSQLEDTQEDLAVARKKCEELELLLKEQGEIVDIRPEIRTPTPTPPKNIEDEEEYIRLKEELEDAKFDLNCFADKLRFAEEECEQQKELYDNLCEEIKQLQRALKEIRDQKAELEARLCESQNNLPFASKGNSMFGEFVEERKHLEADLKQLYAECEGLRRENHDLLNQLEDARLMALRRVGVATTVRCQCEDMRVELVRVRSRLESAENRVNTLNSDKIKMIESLKGGIAVDSMLRAQYSSLKGELAWSNQQLSEMKKERNSLMDQLIVANASLRRAENLERMAKEDVSILTRQIELIKQRQADELRGELDTTELSAAEKISNLIKAPSIMNSMIPSTPAGKAMKSNFKTPLPPTASKTDTKTPKLGSSNITTPNFVTPSSPEPKIPRFAKDISNSENRKEMMTATERRLHRQKVQGPKRAVPSIKPPINIPTFRMVVGTTNATVAPSVPNTPTLSAPSVPDTSAPSATDPTAQSAPDPSNAENIESL